MGRQGRCSPVVQLRFASNLVGCFSLPLLATDRAALLGFFRCMDGKARSLLICYATVLCQQSCWLFLPPSLGHRQGCLARGFKVHGWEGKVVVDLLWNCTLPAILLAASLRPIVQTVHFAEPCRKLCAPCMCCVKRCCAVPALLSAQRMLVCSHLCVHGSDCLGVGCRHL
jgi:hypothetical protein